MHAPSFLRVVKILQMFGESRTQLAQKLGIPQNTFNRYFCDEHEEKLAQYLWIIAELYPQVRREWLFFGEGDMLKDKSESLAPPPNADDKMVRLEHRLDVLEHKIGAFCAAEKDRPVVPLRGFAPCEETGWHGSMCLPIAVDLPTLTEQMLAVVVSGDTMTPAGINSGHVCYCDLCKPPVPGDVVYVERTDGLATLNIFMGKTANPENESGTGQTILQGWLTHCEGEQKTFTLVVDDTVIKQIAPVILVRRRL